VDEKTTLQIERAGKTFFLCSYHCHQEFLSAATCVKLDAKTLRMAFAGYRLSNILMRPSSK
jgi:hypothetical protein